MTDFLPLFRIPVHCLPWRRGGGRRGGNDRYTWCHDKPTLQSQASPPHIRLLSKQHGAASGGEGGGGEGGTGAVVSGHLLQVTHRGNPITAPPGSRVVPADRPENK